jgi:hypothetical protein
MHFVGSNLRHERRLIGTVVQKSAPVPNLGTRMAANQKEERVRV